MSGNDQRYPVYRSQSTTTGASDVSTIRPREVYVIIGRGFAAVANHLTLRASTNPEVRARVDRCRFVMIGGDEPWQARGATPMGQFPHMLGLPAYQALGNDRAYALSSDFGTYIRGAEGGLNRYCEKDLCFPENAWVGLIQTFNRRSKKLPDDEEERRNNAILVGPDVDDWELRPGFPYRLSVFWREKTAEGLPAKKRSLTYLYAHYVDVCTGPGPARLLDPSIYKNGLYDEIAGQPDDQPNYGAPQRLIKGEHHIGAPLPDPTYLPKEESELEDKPKEMARILIYGASPTAAWSAEHVISKCGLERLHWCADPARDPNKDDANSSKPYDERNEAYFMHPLQANPAGGRNTKTVVDTKDQRFLAQITSIEKGNENRLRVTFSVPSDAKEWRAKTVREYDQVVIAAGQENVKERAGSAAYLVQLLGELTPIYAGDLWSDLQKGDKTIPVGLTDERAHLRILGAASVAVLIGKSQQAMDFKTFYAEHAKSLPHEGRAGGNSLLMATTTMELANRFMPARLDANNACPSLIQRLVGTSDMAAQVVKDRQDESFRLPPRTPDSERYFGKGYLTRDELKLVITSDETLNKFNPQS